MRVDRTDSTHSQMRPLANTVNQLTGLVRYWPRNKKSSYGGAVCIKLRVHGKRLKSRIQVRGFGGTYCRNLVNTIVSAPQVRCVTRLTSEQLRGRRGIAELSHEEVPWVWIIIRGSSRQVHGCCYVPSRTAYRAVIRLPKYLARAKTSSSCREPVGTLNKLNYVLTSAHSNISEPCQTCPTLDQRPHHQYPDSRPTLDHILPCPSKVEGDCRTSFKNPSTLLIAPHMLSARLRRLRIVLKKLTVPPQPPMAPNYGPGALAQHGQQAPLTPTSMSRWSVSANQLPPVEEIRSLHVYDFDNTRKSHLRPDVHAVHRVHQHQR